jgi:hypothetical protein
MHAHPKFSTRELVPIKVSKLVQRAVVSNPFLASKKQLWLGGENTHSTPWLCSYKKTIIHYATIF